MDLVSRVALERYNQLSPEQRAKTSLAELEESVREALAGAQGRYEPPPRRAMARPKPQRRNTRRQQARSQQTPPRSQQPRPRRVPQMTPAQVAAFFARHRKQLLLQERKEERRYRKQLLLKERKEQAEARRLIELRRRKQEEKQNKADRALELRIQAEVRAAENRPPEPEDPYFYSEHPLLQPKSDEVLLEELLTKWENFFEN
jgi:hypothetical protein